jgi:subtilisin-like proprotein convertase family protein
VKVEGNPNLAIPDNTPAGVSHVLAVANEGRIQRLSVAVDIAHTFIGDLTVTLVAPTGKTAVLHNRAGGNQDNLVTTFRSEDLPALAALLGDPAQGNWRLQVADLASADVGTLRHWGLEMNLEAATQTLHQEAAPGLAIPDNTPAGVSSSLAIAQAGTVKGVKVSVDITHTFIGDLRVELVAPSGQQVLLHDKSGGNADNLIRSYDSVTSPGLSALAGAATQGNWTLHVSDLAAQDVGKLNRWSLDLAL